MDLNAEGFDPVLTAEDRTIYHQIGANRRLVEPYIGRIMRASTWIVQFPTWNFGPPAILKGFLDRVFLPGVAFDLSNPRRTEPLLTHIRRIVGIVTYGQPRLAAWWMGDPPRKLIKRHLHWHSGGRAQVDFHALYRVNTLTEDAGRAFIDRVGKAVERI